MANLIIRDARLMRRFMNFAGAPGEYNEAGNRNFRVILPPDVDVEVLIADGWPVKSFLGNDGETVFYLKVKVSYSEKFQPNAVLITSRGKRMLTEETIEQLDWTPIKKCDLILYPCPYGPRGNRPGGISVRLNAIYITVKEDELADEYANIPDLDQFDSQ